MLYEKILHGAGNTFSHKIYPQFTMPWHYHREYELILITSGHGKRFVGDSVEDFTTGDLVFIGENLPHFHLCDGLYSNDPERISSSQVIQFTQDIFPEEMHQIPEYAGIYDLLCRSRFGLRFTAPPPVQEISRIMKRIDKFTGIRRITELMRILELLSKVRKYKLLTSANYGHTTAESTLYDDPVNLIFNYLNNHFRENITLESVARQVNLNPSSLCRYFKKRAQKSIFSCLNEIRIGFSCKLLANSDFNVSQIAYDAGFRNIANFNRQFRVFTNMSPTEYRQLYKN